MSLVPDAEWFGSAERRVLLAAALPLLAVTAFGWWATGEERSRPHLPVAGRLLIDDQPAANAVVRLYRDDASGPREAARGEADAQGRFHLLGVDALAGVPAGVYRVTLEWRPLALAGEDLAPGANQLPASWTQPTQTPHRVDIRPLQVIWSSDAHRSAPTVRMQ